MRTLTLAAVLVVAPSVVMADWDYPENLGPLVNSEADEFGLSLSTDNATLYFDSDRVGGEGGKDLYMSTRASGSWQAAVNLGPLVNSVSREYCPSISADDLELLFTTEGFNLHVSAYSGGEWQPGVSLGRPVNTEAHEWAGRFFGDGSTIYFTGYERVAGRRHDVYASTKTGQDWSTPSAVDFSSAADEYAPFVVAGGDSMFLVINGDIHVSRWGGDAWLEPELIPGAANNSNYHDTCPVLSASGDTLYFASERPGGEGGYDIWRSVWTAASIDVGIPEGPSFSLSANEPNPFNPRTTIRFLLSASDHVRLSIYDTAGRRLRTLLEGDASVGATSVEWDGTDDLGHAVASGVYLYRLETSAESQTRKLTLIR